MSKPTEVARPRLSSTVALMRETGPAPEVFLVKRHEASAFGGAYVFPGGVVDDTDCETHPDCLGLAPAEANRQLAIDDGGLDHYVAAIRELFEETGVLLAECAVAPRELEVMRQRLNAASLAWCDFVAAGGVRLCCNELHYFSHWITPDVMAKRFSTRFFIARLPEGQVARHDDGELTDALWITPADALAAAGRDELLIHFPTRKTLEQLAAHASIDAAIAWANERAAKGVAAIQPVMPKGNRRAVPEIPGGPTRLR